VHPRLEPIEEIIRSPQLAVNCLRLGNRGWHWTDHTLKR
jgi:hypothetical protein